MMLSTHREKNVFAILLSKFDESSKNRLFLRGVLLANTLILSCCSAGKFYFSAFDVAVYTENA